MKAMMARIGNGTPRAQAMMVQLARPSRVMTVGVWFMPICLATTVPTARPPDDLHPLAQVWGHALIRNEAVMDIERLCRRGLDGSVVGMAPAQSLGRRRQSVLFPGNPVTKHLPLSVPDNSRRRIPRSRSRQEMGWPSRARWSGARPRRCGAAAAWRRRRCGPHGPGRRQQPPCPCDANASSDPLACGRHGAARIIQALGERLGHEWRIGHLYGPAGQILETGQHVRNGRQGVIGAHAGKEGGHFGYARASCQQQREGCASRYCQAGKCRRGSIRARHPRPGYQPKYRRDFHVPARRQCREWPHWRSSPPVGLVVPHPADVL